MTFKYNVTSFNAQTKHFEVNSSGNGFWFCDRIFVTKIGAGLLSFSYWICVLASAIATNVSHTASEMCLVNIQCIYYM